MLEKSSFWRLSETVGASGSILVIATLLCCLAFSLPAAARETSAATDWLPLAEIHEGMQGYGLTVFSGSRIDTFGVRVLGVQESTRVDGSVILVELSGHDLELTAVSRGMSGSPVYLQGRFAGAVAFGWPGALRPIAGLTPAREMMRLPASLPSGEVQRVARGVVGDATTLLSERQLVAGRRLQRSLFATSEAVVLERLVLDDQWPTPVELARHLLSDCIEGSMRRDGGFSGGSGFLPTDFLYRPTGVSAASATTAVASAAGGGAPALRAGSACAVPLIMGDAQIGAIGTTTVVDGDRVLALGHPLMQRGPVNLPLAVADIVTVFPSRDISFKMGTIGEIVGAVHHDQRAGVSGRLGASPPLIPVRVEVVVGASVKLYEYQVVDDPQLTPSLVFWSFYNSLLAESDDAGSQSVVWELDATWRRGDSGETLRLAGHGGANDGVASLSSELMAPLQILMGNRYESIVLEHVEARLTLQRPAAEALIAAAVAPLRAESSESINVEVTLEKRRGGAETVSFSLALARHLPPGSYRLLVASARDLFALEAERASGRFADRSLNATLDLIRTPRSAAQLVVALLEPGGGLLLDGCELAGLPGSVESVLRKNISGRIVPTLAGFVGITRLDTDLSLHGFVIRKIEIVSPVHSVQEGSRR